MRSSHQLILLQRNVNRNDIQCNNLIPPYLKIPLNLNSNNVKRLEWKAFLLEIIVSSFNWKFAKLRDLI